MMKAMERKKSLEGKSYNLGRFFFWFDTNWNLVKFYDRQYETDYFVKDGNFDVPFREAVSKLTDSSISELEAKIREIEYKRICAEVLAEMANNPYVS